MVNNPVNFVDPSGEIVFLPLLLAAGSSAIFSAAIEVGLQYASGSAQCGLNLGAIGREAAIGGALGLIGGGVATAAKSAKNAAGHCSSRMPVPKANSGRDKR